MIEKLIELGYINNIPVNTGYYMRAKVIEGIRIIYQMKYFDKDKGFSHNISPYFPEESKNVFYLKIPTV